MTQVVGNHLLKLNTLKNTNAHYKDYLYVICCDKNKRKWLIGILIFLLIQIRM